MDCFFGYEILDTWYWMLDICLRFASAGKLDLILDITYQLSLTPLSFGEGPGERFYSDLRLFTGFISAALMAWKLTVINAIKTASNPANKKIHGLMLMR